MLALYHFGVFPDAARWLSERLPHFLVLPSSGVKQSLPLQYAYYTFIAFSTAWIGLELGETWKKYLYLLVLTFLTLLLSPLLALQGMLFEPFSGALAACFAGLIGIMLSDRTQHDTPAPDSTESTPATPDQEAAA